MKRRQDLTAREQAILRALCSDGREDEANALKSKPLRLSGTLDFASASMNLPAKVDFGLVKSSTLERLNEMLRTIVQKPSLPT